MMNDQELAPGGRPGRRPTGQVIVRKGRDGPSFAIRVTAYGRRHQFGLSPHITTRAQADEELANVLADVRRGTWRPPTMRLSVEEPRDAPTFHVFSSEWFERHRHEVRENTTSYWLELLSGHLLPYFADYPLDRITPELVDGYKTANRERERWDNATPEERKLRLLSQGLGLGRINRSLAPLARILDEAIDYGRITTANPAVGKRRRLKTSKPTRTWLELHETRAVLDAAGGNRALIATMMLGGLRVGELIALRWRDVNLATGTLRVAQAKTDAGLRVVDVTPMLREELALHRAISSKVEPDDLVFSTGKGTPLNRNNIRHRVVGKAVEQANAALTKAGSQPIADVITNHSLRRTFASLLYEAGASPAYVMEQMGHTSPGLALEVYAKKMARSRDTGERMDALIRGADWAQKGAEGADPVAAFATE